MSADDRRFTVATWGVQAATVLIVGSALARVTQFVPEHATLAGLATAAYLPLHLWHIHHAARGRRPRAVVWTVVAMASVIVGVLPVIGVHWLGAFFPLGVSILLVLHPRWSVPLFGLLVAAQLVWCVWIFDVPAFASNFVIVVGVFGVLLSVPVWLIATLRELAASRATLAEEAVWRERLRIDHELSDSLGSTLETVAATATAAEVRIGDAPSQAEAELLAVTRAAREALSCGRDAIRRVQRSTLADELAAGVGLLRTAGCSARLELLTESLPATAPASLRETLRAELARLLQDRSTRHCALIVRLDQGAVRVEVRSESAAGLRQVIAE
ncbi:MAG: histidine kinase [Micromonosporaceae bacterium]